MCRVAKKLMQKRNNKENPQVSIENVAPNPPLLFTMPVDLAVPWPTLAGSKVKTATEHAIGLTMFVALTCDNCCCSHPLMEAKIVSIFILLYFFYVKLTERL